MRKGIVTGVPIHSAAQVPRWLDIDGTSYREIVRQQWNFSPPGSTSEAQLAELRIA